MPKKLPKRYIKALRGDLDVKIRKAPAPLTTIRNPDLPKWDYKAGGYTRSIKEQSAYMKEKAQKKADKKFKEEAGFGDYALEAGGYASAAYLYFKLPKLRNIVKKAVYHQGFRNYERSQARARRQWQNPKLFDTTRMPKTQRLFWLENITRKFKEGPGTKQQKSYVIRSLLTGPGADKLEKDILKKTPTATEKVFLKGRQKMREFLQKGEIITKKEFKSKGKTKLLKQQNMGYGNMTRTIKSKSKMPEVQKKIFELRENTRGKLISKSVKETGGKLPQFQTRGKQRLLAKQTTRTRGGGSPGGAGKFNWIGKMRSNSPWSLLKNDKSY